MHSMQHLSVNLAILLFLGSCASGQNLANDGPGFGLGGYKITEVKVGVYRIIAKTNVTPFASPETARRMWAEHAAKACEGTSYKEDHVQEYSYEPLPPTWIGLKYISSVKEGLALCEN